MSGTISTSACVSATRVAFFNATTGFNEFHSSNPTVLPYGLCDKGDYM